MKKWRYRKITPKQKQEMRRLREQGWTYVRIAKKFGVAPSTATYHCSEKYRQQTIRRAQRCLSYRENKNRAKEGYMTEYMRERFRSDAEFQQRMKKHIHTTCKKRREAAKKLAKENPEVREKLRAYWRGEIPYSGSQEILQFNRQNALRGWHGELK